MKYLTYSLMCIVSVSCETPVCCDPGPEPFFAVIHTQEGKDYLAQHTDVPVELYYFENEEKVNLSPVVSFHQDTAYLTEVGLPWKSADGVKDFYLEVNGDVDTLYVDVRERKWKYNSVKFNGEEAGNYLNKYFLKKYIY